MNKYYYEPDELLNDVIEFTSFRRWYIDKELALGLCEYMVLKYLSGGLPEVSTDYMEGPALEQIIDNFPENTLEEINDPVWERFLFTLYDEYVGDTETMYERNDMLRLKNIIRRREFLPRGYEVA